MNQNDFYKQLMSEYSFDADKIKENAKKGRYAKQKISPLAIGLTAAVAACTVACGTLAVNMVNNKSGVDLIDSGKQSLSALSSSERVKIAIEQQNKAHDSNEICDVLVTFNSAIPASQARDIVTAYTDDSMPVKAAYLADGSRITDNASVKAVFDDDSAVTALWISCEGSVMAQLQLDEDIWLAELVDESELNTVIPIDPEQAEDIQPIIPEEKPDDIIDVPSVTIPDEVVIPDDDGFTDIVPDEQQTVEAGETVEDSGNTEADNETVEDNGDESVGEDETTESVDNAEDNDGETVDAGEETPVEDEVVAPVIPALPDDVELPLNPEATILYEYYTGADTAFFLTDNIYFSQDSESISIHRFAGNVSVMLDKVECTEAKICWISDSDGRMIVSGLGDNGTRNKMYLVDANSSEIFDLYAEDTVMDGTLCGVGYNNDNHVIVLNIRENGKYYICTLLLNATTAQYIATPFEAQGTTTLLGSYEDNIYVAVSDGTLTQIHAVNVAGGSSRIIKTYDNKPEFSRNYAFNYAMVYPSENALTGSVEIFDPATESFIATPYFNETIYFGVSDDTFCVGGSYYKIVGGSIESTGGINAIGEVDYRRSLSAYYSAYVNNGVVFIIDSVYNKRNAESMLYFGDISSSAEAEFIAVIDGAIGINNALALGQCKQIGIDSTDELNDCIELYYSKNAADSLTELCDIPMYGALRYVSGGLEAMRANDTRLVVSSIDGDTASGVLYVKAGVFGGKTAYRMMNVSFVREGNLWKADTLIGK